MSKQIVKKISTLEVPSIIAAIPKGQIFTVTFIKKNGEVREMNCRRGVVCGLKEGARHIAPDTKNITVYDMKIANDPTVTDPSKAYRKINPETVISIKATGSIYEVTKGQLNIVLK
jgi:hypothetical protein